MNAQEMWTKFAEQTGISHEYEAWPFGDDPDTLANLVLKGIKTGTASGYPFYILEGEPLPKEGGYNVILDSQGNAVCITRTTKVYVTPFRSVTSDHAWKEGEGNRSLDYWRKVHESFFIKEMESIGQTFDWNMDVVCEEFIKVYP